MNEQKLRTIGVITAGAILLGIILFAFLQFRSSSSPERYSTQAPTSIVGATSYLIIDPQVVGEEVLPDSDFKKLHDQTRKDGEWIVRLDNSKANEVGGRVPGVIATIRGLLGSPGTGRVENVYLLNTTRTSASMVMRVVFPTPDAAESTSAIPITLVYTRSGDSFSLDSISTDLEVEDEISTEFG